MGVMFTPGARITIKGDKAVADLLRQLPDRIQNKVIARALMASAGPILQMARSAAPTGQTGLLKKSIKARIRPKKREYTRLVVIGPTSMPRLFRRTKGGKLRGVSAKKAAAAIEKGEKLIKMNPRYYGSQVEFGHGGQHPAGPHAFMRPAFDAMGGAAFAAFQAKLVEGIESETARLKK